MTQNVRRVAVTAQGLGVCQLWQHYRCCYARWAACAMTAAESEAAVPRHTRSVLTGPPRPHKATHIKAPVLRSIACVHALPAIQNGHPSCAGDSTVYSSGLQRPRNLQFQAAVDDR